MKEKDSAKIMQNEIKTLSEALKFLSGKEAIEVRERIKTLRTAATSLLSDFLFPPNVIAVCPEEKIFGIRKKDIPIGHELRYLYPGKFADGGSIAQQIEAIENEKNILLQAIHFLKGKQRKDVEEKIDAINQARGLLAGHEEDWKAIFSSPEKFMRYDGQFLYPPRIEHKLQPSSLDRLDTGEYIGQPKLNGSNTSVAVSENTSIAKERHNTFFAIPPKFDFKAMHRGSGWMSFAGEYMNKSKKDHTGKPFRGFCIWDIMAYENQILIGSTIEERANLIDLLYPSRGTAVAINGIDILYYTDIPDIYKVADFRKDFHKIYNEIIAIDMIEGFVMKRKTGKLENMTREANNTGWAVKVRKPTANYQFFRGGKPKGFFVGATVGIIKGEHAGEKGYITDIDTEYTIDIGRGKVIKARDGDFYNFED